MDPATAPHAGGCPRCGTRIERGYRYCPNCAYSLLPDLAAQRPPPAPAPSTGDRLLGWGGYVVLIGLLAVVVVTGMRLFRDEEVFMGVAKQSSVARDAEILPIGPKSFHTVTGGAAAYGFTSLDRGPDTITLVDDPFRLGVHEVTNDDYYAFLAARAERSGEAVPDRLYPENWSRPTGNRLVRLIYDRDTGKVPVVAVEFAAATEFCAWLWEDRFAANQNLVVDLPTADEYVRAGRGDRWESNFPWDGPLVRGQANLDGALLAADDERCGLYHGVLGLVGNAAEWVHAGPAAAAAGWSFVDDAHLLAWQRPELSLKPTPFSKDSVTRIDGGRPRPYVGFRVVVRPAPTLPVFVAVQAGKVRTAPPPIDDQLRLLPPVSLESGEPVAAVDLGWTAAEVYRPFEIAASEITNRQYLAFLVDQARSLGDAVWPFPRSFTRLHPFADWSAYVQAHDEVVNDKGQPFDELVPTSPFLGPYGDPRIVPFIYPPGAANQPVQGVTAAQAQAYADWLGRTRGDARRECRLPTVQEFLRAGRGDLETRYPWGDSLDPRLIASASRRDDEDRPVSPLRFGTSDEIFGLAGNVAELVRNGPGGRMLLAGGFYLLPPAYCSLDTLFDPEWEYIEVATVGEEAIGPPYWLIDYTGFRVVLVPRS
ncbi:MAG: formylglycine-generating enzyme family protein [Planctomycetota bacterium]